MKKYELVLAVILLFGLISPGLFPIIGTGALRLIWIIWSGVTAVYLLYLGLRKKEEA